MEFAAGITSAFVGVVFTKLSDAFLSKLRKIKNAEKEFENLEVTVAVVKRMMRELNLWKYQHTDHNLLQSRFRELTTLCYDAEDLIDKVTITVSSINDTKTKSLSSIPDDIANLNKQLVHMKEQLVSLKGEVTTTVSSINDRKTILPRTRKRWSSSTVPEILVGRDNDVNKICDELISCGAGIKGVSIVGMHGVGKTALAETIFSDSRIAEKFPVRVELLVSDGVFNDYDTAIKDLEKYFLLCKQNKNTGANTNLLIMFDNLLSIQDEDVWNQLWVTINQNKISDVKMLVTTLDPKVSQLTETKAHVLEPLQPDDSKTVIMNAASQSPHNCNKTSSQPVFEQIANLLARKWEGLPLVAKTIGHIMAKYDEKFWPWLSEKNLWELPDFTKFILPTLLSSDTYMHPTSELCFLYFSLFPKNYQFNSDKLVQLWAGEGFCPPGKDSSTLESTASSCLKDLLARSILQCSDNENKVYKLPSFTHQFAQFTSSGRCLMFDNEDGKSTLTTTTRHLSLLRVDDKSSIWSKKNLQSLKRLRTVLAVHKENRPIISSKVQIPTDFFNKFKYLRVLALNRTNVRSIPSSIRKLIHLRYIDVSCTPIHMLAKDISRLSNLQFLNFNNTEQLKSLPKSFHQLTNLISLDWNIDDIKRVGLPSNIGKLHYLETLPLFCVGDKLGFSVGELENMNRLQNSICIMGLENVKNGNQAKQAKLDDKLLLTQIEFQWNATHDGGIANEVLTALRPHNFLQHLKINGYGGCMFPAWISDPSLNVRNLHLYKCHCRSLPALGQLKALKSLVVEGMSNLKKVDKQFCGDPNPAGSFPYLEQLEFNDMAKFEQWIELENIGMPSLCNLRFKECPNLIELPSLKNLGSLKEVEVVRCPKLETLPNLPASLNSLMIEDCEKLKDNYNVGGAKCGTISRIPRVLIDFHVVQFV